MNMLVMSGMVQLAVMLPTFFLTGCVGVLSQEKVENRIIARLEGHDHSVIAVAFRNDEEELMTVSSRGELRHWDLKSGREINRYEISTGPPVNDASFSSDGKWVVLGCGNTNSYVWDLKCGSRKLTLVGHDASVVSVSFSPDSKSIATAGTDASIRLWNANSGKQFAKLIGHDGYINTVCFSPSGRLLASGGRDRLIRIWDVSSGDELRRLEGHRDDVSYVTFSPSGRLLASGSDDGTVRLWNVATGNEIEEFRQDQGTVSFVVFSNDERILASGEACLYVREIATGQDIVTLPGHGGDALCAVFSENGNILATGSADLDMDVILWDLAPDEDVGISDSFGFDQLWKMLKSRNARKAYSGIWALAKNRITTLSQLEQKLDRPSTAKTNSLFRDLDSDKTSVREEAEIELVSIGAESSVRAALAKRVTPETRIRLKRVLNELESPMPQSGAQLRRLRMIQVLERIGTKQSEELLRKIGSFHANESLDRLMGRKKRR